MNTDGQKTYTSFHGLTKIVSGPLREMLCRTKEVVDRSPSDPVLIFEDWSGQQVDFNFRGTIEEVCGRAEPSPAPTSGARGRPRLGVTSREVSLLPRHWEWLESQPNGASSALRRLVEEASKRNAAPEKARHAAEAAGRFMWAMAGNLPGFEEASRALYARDGGRFELLTRGWPQDIREHVIGLASPCFAEEPPRHS